MLCLGAIDWRFGAIDKPNSSVENVLSPIFDQEALFHRARTSIQFARANWDNLRSVAFEMLELQ